MKNILKRECYIHQVTETATNIISDRATSRKMTSRTSFARGECFSRNNIIKN